VTHDLDHLLDALDKLPPDQLPEAIGALETAKARAWARLTAPPAVAPSPSHCDSTVDVAEAARLLSMSRSWVYRNASSLPFTRRVGRRALRFSTSGIRRYLAAHGG
jgi:predicted DNA-binding transcriptional regulator AlpA